MITRVVGAVIRRQDRVLCGRRRAGLSQAGQWEFPGGKVEAGESDQPALARELAEELGVLIEVGSRLSQTVSATAEGRLIELVCYEARLVAPEPGDHTTGQSDGYRCDQMTSRDHDLLVWQRLEDLAELDFSAPDRPTVALLLNQSVERPSVRGKSPDRSA
ncbi:MAG: (deoxy)nucleoside triphosphate pyrophosphohydrolase [Propionibacteriaceae bacterium]|nr:(deoxy)nucleoside triphosphate pyrophosphohydrolase [Propionibacteriaceae bacterium]